ncbi:addiction module protein [Marispirochaeta sp.]|jgi:putative addiction module component (TIGR02574 family)|uniref:addiction module protein n=1 Tax=Marispirochaeta sp. TaxID=2038653 RepID=UPI0029C93C2A|nr:addiction module protein [Marispirochaeta sp.]
MNTREFIDEAISLPVEERARIVDSLLQSLNMPETKLDKKWTSTASRRLKELKNGTIEAIPGKEVFEKVWKRFHE